MRKSAIALLLIVTLSGVAFAESGIERWHNMNLKAKIEYIKAFDFGFNAGALWSSEFTDMKESIYGAISLTNKELTLRYGEIISLIDYQFMQQESGQGLDYTTSIVFKRIYDEAFFKAANKIRKGGKR